VSSLFSGRRRRSRVVRASAAACAGIAAAVAFFATQATAQPTKNVMVYTDQTVGCVWVGDGPARTYIPTGYTAGWRSTGIQAAVNTTVTAKTYLASCEAVKRGGVYGAKNIAVNNAPTNLHDLWLNTDSAPTGNFRVSHKRNLPDSGKFVMFSNRSGFAPYVCLSAWADWDHRWSPSKPYILGPNNTATPAPPADVHQCKRLLADQHALFHLKTWPGGHTPLVQLSVATSGTTGTSFSKHADFQPDPYGNSCYRETLGGSVHQVTNQPCTSS
jgi:hypothetical protein